MIVPSSTRSPVWRSMKVLSTSAFTVSGAVGFAAAFARVVRARVVFFASAIRHRSPGRLRG